MGHDIAAAIGAVAFWTFVAAAAVTSILVQYFKLRETQKTIRQAIDKGQALDSEIVAQLLAASRPPPPNRAALVLGGLVMVCIGVGVGLMSWFASLDHPEMLHTGLGIACLIAMIGAPLLIASALLKPNGAGRE